MREGIQTLERQPQYGLERSDKPRRPGRTAVLGRLGALEIRLATTPAEIAAAQALRAVVFRGRDPGRLSDHDVDAFDAFCDHLIVVDHSSGQVVGTYRLLRSDIAAYCGGFYSASEFQIAPLLRRHPGMRFLELGRSCVLERYRSKRTVELLWHGIWSYVLRHRIDVMFGCASLPGTDFALLAEPLTLLHRTAAAPPEWCAMAHRHRYVPMERMSGEVFDQEAAFRRLPPLVKGYLRVGASVGDGAVIDEAFGTTDVLMVLPIAKIDPRYVRHFGESAGRYAGEVTIDAVPPAAPNAIDPFPGSGSRAAASAGCSRAD